MYCVYRNVDAYVTVLTAMYAVHAQVALLPWGEETCDLTIESLPAGTQAIVRKSRRKAERRVVSSTPTSCVHIHHTTTLV